MKKVKAFNSGSVILFLALIGVLCCFSNVMGFANFCSTAMKTSHDLLLNTVFFITAISVLSGALGSFLSEFGILALLNWLFAPFIRFFWGLPGAAAMGAMSAYISDNPAIISLAKDKSFIRYFQDSQKPALTNFGTSFGMGLILTAFMMSLGFFKAALIGNMGALVGSVVSTRLMLRMIRNENFDDASLGEKTDFRDDDVLTFRMIRDGNVFQRLLDSILEGGKSGLEMGLQIIPGVLVICTIVLMLTFGPGNGYNGSAYQGIAILPEIGGMIFQPLRFLFGFSSPDAIAFPVTSLGAAGAALGLIPRFLNAGLINGNDIAVFTSIGMCWSGYLSTHVAMMDAMGCRKLVFKAILSHTLGGIVAGVAAHNLYILISNSRLFYE
jgi:hypothetical protein